ncbi:MAG: alanine racemase [Hyphomonadaceae bacterium]
MTGPHAEIDVSAVVRNWRMLAKRAGAANTAAVVKADAYGLGAEKIAPALARAGCTSFYVAWPSEGETLRRLLGAGPDIAVFSGLSSETAAAHSEFALTAVLNTPEQVRLWLDMGSAAPRAALHIDTGMNRLGVRPETCADLASAMGSHAPARLISHLACADDPTDAMNQRQLDTFVEATRAWHGVPRSLSATAGIYLGTAFCLDEVRPGIGLYGGGPSPLEGDAPEPVVRLTAPILQIRELPAGETIGYGATWTAPDDRVVATIGIGYADGFLRTGSGRAVASVGGVICPLRGRVSMDLIGVDITGVAAQVGDPAELIGPSVHVSDQAGHMATIDYELLTRIGPRVARSYVETQ